jgi:cytidylate kinase
MERLELYLSENYLKEKEQQKSIRELIKKVIPTYEKFYEDAGWSYKLGEIPENISTSTTAMVAFSMSVLMSKKLDLVIEETGENFFEDYDSNSSENKFERILSKSLVLLLEAFKNEKKELDRDKKSIEKVIKEKFTFKSNTYGENDPFTLMWARYLIDNNQCEVDDFPEIREKFDEICKNKVMDIFTRLYKDKNNVEFSSEIERTHIFPLLKIVQLYYAMTSTVDNENKDKFGEGMNEEAKKDIIKYVNEVRSTLQNSLHYHLSLASIENSNFDAAELVFSLEGLLLLDFNRDNFDKNLLDRVFEVIKERQDISLYWRPLKPFVFNEQGLALLPLSVEIAMSLIRICRLLGKRGEKLFSKNYEMFEKYTEWLKTRVTVYPCDKETCGVCETEEWCSKKASTNEKKFYGWCSEHIYQPNIIHPWETSQALVYLVNFNDMLQKHIAYQSFKFANLSIKDYGNSKEAWKEWQKTEPVTIDGFKVYEDIGEHYISNNTSVDDSNYYSMLLYGPPGTGKSTIAEKIAEAKGWPLVTITPSDFIASGADQVETKAKSIFKVLEEQEKMVVLFDEIDRLIIDRDSEYYTKQSDLFQFMTPSMLVKLKDIRSKKKIIFIIATNYSERIDMAIKRKGRIDKHYIVLPPDMAGRDRLYKKFFKGGNADTNYAFEEYKDLILRNTALFTFTEFKQLPDVIKGKIVGLIKENEGKEKLKKLIGKPAITLMNYSGKLGTTKEEKNVQKPIKEFLSLVFLKAETYDKGTVNIFDENELKLLIDLLESKEMIGRCIKGKPIDKLRVILKDQNALKTKLQEYIQIDMAEKIIEALKGIIQSKVRVQR